MRKLLLLLFVCVFTFVSGACFDNKFNFEINFPGISQSVSSNISSDLSSSLNISTSSSSSSSSFDSSKISSSSSSSRSSSNSSSSNNSEQNYNLYEQYDNVYTYLDKFETEKQVYNNLTDKTGVCRVHFVDVGQGDCMIIELPDDKIMVIDAGDRDSEIEVAIENYISKLQITQIDYMIATHQDADHIGNMDAFFDNTQVNYVYRPYVLYQGTKDTSGWASGFNKGCTNAQGGKVSTTATYYNFLQMILDESGCGYEFYNKDTYISGNALVNSQNLPYYFDFLTPTAEIQNIKYTDANDYSPIVLFNYCGVDILFTGDAEAEVMQEYLTHYGSSYDIDVLKVGHHGSLTSTSDAYVKALRPEYSVIQVGEGNSYNHPRQQVLDILYNNNSLVYRNDKNGDIVLTICPDGTFFFETEIRSDYQSVLNGL